MCELMSLCFAQPVSADFSIREFGNRDESNADGWGLAWYPDRSVAVVKEPISWRASKYTGFLESYHALLSSIYIAHVRHKTVGGKPTHADTHPFARELGGRDYCFAHNGTLLGLAEQCTLERYRPVGGTDSEFAFCHLMDELSRSEEQLATELSWSWLHEKLMSLNRLGKLNCQLSDGQRLFCFHDRNGHNGLTLRKVHIANHQVRHFEDSELQIDVEGNSVNHGFAVATHPLSSSGWNRFFPGELIVFERGEVCFSSHRKVTAAEFAPAKGAARALRR